MYLLFTKTYNIISTNNYLANHTGLYEREKILQFYFLYKFLFDKYQKKKTKKIFNTKKDNSC